MQLIKLYLLLSGTLLINNVFAAPTPHSKSGINPNATMNSITDNLYGPTVQTTRDGTKIINNPDGSSVQIHPDGTLFVINSDGSTIQKNPDGTETSRSN